jgi:two-component system, NarL family, nitrate/nitrite response regulator NarL
MTRILIADDHQIFRHGLRKLLETESDLTVCGEAGSAAETVSKVRQLRPDLLLLDLAMPGVSGVDALRDLAGDTDHCRVLLLTGAIEQDQLVAAMRLGASGVVLKDAPTPMLLGAIRSVVAGDFWIGRERIASLVKALRPSGRGHGPEPPGEHGLTERERTIVSGVVAAFGNREIANALGISEKTVKQHLTNIFDKLGVSTRVELAMFAVRHNLHLPRFPPPG